MATRVAFYAPLKSPNHPIPSGDREIARLMMRALRLAGFQVDLMSEVISYQKRPSRELFETRQRSVEAERGRLTEAFVSDAGARPDLWFTYHPYCKAPDWLGPPLCRRFAIPYVTAEACRTRQANDIDWQEARAAVQDAVRFARVNFVLKESDWAYLEGFMPGMATSRRIAPFLDMQAQPAADPVRAKETAVNGPRILAAAMMRPGAKAESYQLLRDALDGLDDRDWSLLIAGEGPQRTAIETAFGAMAERVRFVGSVSHDEVLRLMDRSDLLAWPGIGEAIGMVFLEAQSRGLPVVALRTAGVPLVVTDGTGGLLSPEGDVAAYRRCLRTLIDDAELRKRLGARGKAYVSKHHDVSAVATLFRKMLGNL